ncbi:MAG: hypothetical protein ACPLX7_06735 [Candidatus Kapaibacteriota bacterium]|jgi:hypothetical protein
METSLSVLFTPERTYFALLEKTNIGLKLHKIGTSSSPIDLENLDNPINKDSLAEHYELFHEFSDCNSMAVTIPMEYVILTQFPGRPNITKDEIMSVINIEIRQNLPQFNPDEFPTYLFELVPRGGHSHFLAAIIPKQIFQSIKIIATKINKIVDIIEISQISSHNSLLYNYPEEKENVVALFNISDKFIDFSVFKNKDFYFYNLLKYNSLNDTPEIINNGITKIQTELQLQINSIFLFGSQLNRSTLDILKSRYGERFLSIKRLNPFRLVSNELSEVDKQICARIAHHFVPCVGSVIPEIHKKIKIY